jgi:hypothetical protein
MATGFIKIRKMMKGFPVKLVEFKEDARGSWRIKLENGMTYFPSDKGTYKFIYG